MKQLMEELRSAGLAGLPVVYKDNGEVEFSPDVKATQRQQIEKIVANHFKYSAKRELLDYASAKRYDREVGGIEIKGRKVATDRESHALINSAVNLTTADPDIQFKFKAKDGFIDLDADGVITVATAVAQHIQDCFSLEAGVVAKIESGKIKSMSEIDEAFRR